MKKLLFSIAILGLMAGFSGKIMAQTSGTDDLTLTMPVVKVIGIDQTSGANAILFAAPVIPGNEITNTAATKSWLNYTSIIAAETTHKITAQISTSDILGDVGVPDHTTLKVTAGVPSADGSDNTDLAKGVAHVVTLTKASDQLLVGLIKSCWTGSGAEKGRNLTYDWTIDQAYTATSNAVADLVITYTIGLE